MTEEVRDIADDILSPQQTAGGMTGGISSVIHGARTLLERHPTWVVLKLDMRHIHRQS